MKILITTLFLLLFPACLFAASPEKIGTNTWAQGTGTKATSLTFEHTVPTGSENTILIVFVSNSTIGVATGITWNGDAMTKAIGNTITFFYTSVWYIVNPDTGTHNVVVTAPNSQIMASAITLENAAQTDPIDDATENYASGTSLSTTITTTEDNELAMVFSTVHDDASSLTQDGSQTEQINEQFTNYAHWQNVGSIEQTSAGDVSPGISWTGSGACEQFALGVKYAEPTPPAPPVIKKQNIIWF